MSIPKHKSPELLATGWFTELEGPWGQMPVQFTGRLSSGEYVYFRARGTEISLEIYATAQDADEMENAIACYCKTVKREDVVPARQLAADPESIVLGAGVLAVDTCVALIKEWVSTYRTHQEQAKAQSKQVEPYLAVLALGSMVSDCPYRYRAST